MSLGPDWVPQVVQGLPELPSEAVLPQNKQKQNDKQNLNNENKCKEKTSLGLEHASLSTLESRENTVSSIFYFSHCCDKIPSISDLRKGGH